MISWATVIREMRMHFRSSWTYSFIAFLTLFVGLIMNMYGNMAGIGQYTKATGTLMNLLAFLLPLMALVIGAFSLTMEKEDGTRNLLFTYPISSIEWIAGKVIGLLIVLLTTLTFAFSIGGIIGFVTGFHLEARSILMLFGYSGMLVTLFLAISIVIGTVSKTRWQALTISISVWIVFVLAWPILLMTILHSLPYQTLVQTIEIATLLNPLEFTRIFFMVKLGGGEVLGPEYLKWVVWIKQSYSVIFYIGLSLIWIFIMLLISVIATERSRSIG